MSKLFTNQYTEKINFPNGEVVELETGKFARQSGGSVMLKVGKLRLLATAVAGDAKEGIDFFPLTVEYKEKFASAGRFPGGFLKREARPQDQEILNSRIIDRTIRPAFPKGYRCETQVIVQLLSSDERYSPDSFACLAASTAINISDIPFNMPVACTRVVKIDGELAINPSNEMAKKATLDIVLGASKDSVMMVEGEMDEVSEEEMIEAILFGHEMIKISITAQENLATKIGKPKKEFVQADKNIELEDKLKKSTFTSLEKAVFGASSKEERKEEFSKIFEEFKNSLDEEDKSENLKAYSELYEGLKKDLMRKSILEKDNRLDGRKTTDIRPIECEIDILPSPHGSSLFTRGETQSLTTATLGNSMDANVLDTVSLIGEERFYLHYNFPPFSTGEARPMRGTSRREIGHGNLAQRALKRVVPEDCPYTVRVVSEILESNGSSSMATVCAGTLALMDAGIKIKAPVSGIAMGLILEGDKYAILSDILGDEDYMGDMDFKVTGTKKGITACQMDIKIAGLSNEILKKALLQAREGRLHILDVMDKCIQEPREEVKDGVPLMKKITIPKEFIGAVIGPAGKNIQKLQEDTQTNIVIEEKDNLGHIEILSSNKDNIAKVLKTLESITFIPEIGKTYKGIVKSIKPFGAFIAINGSFEALLHISEFSNERIDSLEGKLNEKDTIEVKIIGTDPKTGKFRLSRKALL